MDKLSKGEREMSLIEIKYNTWRYIQIAKENIGNEEQKMIEKIDTVVDVTRIWEEKEIWSDRGNRQLHSMYLCLC